MKIALFMIVVCLVVNSNVGNTVLLEAGYLWLQAFYFWWTRRPGVISCPYSGNMHNHWNSEVTQAGRGLSRQGRLLREHKRWGDDSELLLCRANFRLFPQPTSHIFCQPVSGILFFCFSSQEIISIPSVKLWVKEQRRDKCVGFGGGVHDDFMAINSYI